MVEAKHNVQQAQLSRKHEHRSQGAGAARIGIVKDQLRAKGLRGSSFAHRDIVALAHDYIAALPQPR